MEQAAPAQAACLSRAAAAAAPAPARAASAPVRQALSQPWVQVRCNLRVPAAKLWVPAATLGQAVGTTTGTTGSSSEWVSPDRTMITVTIPAGGSSRPTTAAGGGSGFAATTRMGVITGVIEPT
ncbi:MAG: hypothetical protein E6G84_05510 [Alphaproteobacteria bacterium]|nr:MAG: hypothetical protein E6G88_07130 [Alphaproteobacteria bacterium]TMJ52900.1 MAG: hypothetical protein E6G84_05510 [Alphaproteobacteria bacterium]